MGKFKHLVDSNEGIHWNCHPSLYEGDHRNDHLSDFPIIYPFPLGSVPNAHSWWDPVLSPKLFHNLLGIN